jgi:hypothetical protein
MRLRLTLAVALLAAAKLSAEIPLQERPAEYAVKAAFLFNFAKFVDWPPEAFANGSPMTICVLGEDPFGDTLDSLTRGEHVNGRDIAIRRPRGLEEARACHILFISASERHHVLEILYALRGASVLTVGDMEDFAQLGGVIRLAKQNYRIGLEISAQAAERAHVKISSKLWSLARIVDRAPS